MRSQLLPRQTSHVLISADIPSEEEEEKAIKQAMDGDSVTSRGCE